MHVHFFGADTFSFSQASPSETATSCGSSSRASAGHYGTPSSWSHGPRPRFGSPRSEGVQIAAQFNGYDRLADGLGIDSEPEWAE